MPEGVSAEMAVQALATLGGAVTAAQTLAPPLNAALTGAAQAAFVDALQVCAIVGALIVLLAGALAARILRNGARVAAPSRTADASTSPGA